MKKLFIVIKQPLLSGSLILVIGSILASFLNYLFHLILGRMLGPNDYGELVALISLIGLLGIIPASLNLVVVKYISAASDEKKISALIRWFKIKVVFTAAFLILAILLLSPFITTFLKINNLNYFILIAGGFFFSLQGFLNKSLLQGLLKFKETVMGTLIENSSKLVFSIALVYLGLRVGGVMWAFVISAVLGWYITNFFLPGYKKQISVAIKSMPIMLFMVPVLLQSLSTTVLYTTDIILVKHFFSNHDAGIYASLSNLGKIIFFGAGPIGAVMFPLTSQRYARKQPYKTIFVYSFFATLIFALPILFLYWFFPQLAIDLLYGPSYLEAAPLLIWYGIFITLFTLAALFISFHLSLGQTKVVILPSVAAIVQGLGIWLFHKDLLTIIIVSILVTALLLGSLLIYFFRKINLAYETKTSDRLRIDYSTSL